MSATPEIIVGLFSSKFKKVADAHSEEYGGLFTYWYFTGIHVLS